MTVRTVSPWPVPKDNGAMPFRTDDDRGGDVITRTKMHGSKARKRIELYTTGPQRTVLELPEGYPGIVNRE